MTPRELQALILATPACAAFVHTNDMPNIGAEEARAKDQSVADALLSSGALTQNVSRKIGVGDLLGELGIQTGGAIYSRLRALAASDIGVELALHMLDAATLDIGHPQTQAAIDALPGFSDEEKAAMKDMARSVVTVTASEVSIALRGPWGDE